MLDCANFLICGWILDPLAREIVGAAELPGAALGIAILYRLVASLGDGIGFIAGSVAEMRPHTDTAGSGRYSSPED